MIHEGSTKMDTDPVLDVRGLTVKYGDIVALRDVSLAVPRGAVTAIIGPSGCGKSSFLSVLNRLTDMIPGCEVTGSVRLDGEPIHAEAQNLIALRRRVGMIFQRPNPFPTSIRCNIDVPLRESGVRRRSERNDIIRDVLCDVGLWDEVKDRLETSAQRLSGGQQQRLCIARALALRPDVLLFDEPCSALDPISSGVVEDLIQKLRNRQTIVIVTHNLSQARRLADYVAMFWNQYGAGRLIEYGAADRIFEQPVNHVTASYVDGTVG